MSYILSYISQELQHCISALSSNYVHPALCPIKDKYFFFTDLAFYLCILFILVVIIIKLKLKRPTTLLATLIIIFCCGGIYLTIPSRLLYCYCKNSNSVQMLEFASKISLLKKEREILYGYLGEHYSNPFNNAPDGNLAIEYFKKSVPDSFCTMQLAKLYLIKGDYKSLKWSVVLLNKDTLWAYKCVLEGDYEHALSILTLMKKKSRIYKSKFPGKEDYMVYAIHKKLGHSQIIKDMEKDFAKMYLGEYGYDPFDKPYFKRYDNSEDFDKTLLSRYVYDKNGNKLIKVYGRDEKELEKNLKSIRRYAEYLSVDSYKEFILEQRKLLRFE